MGAGKNKVHRKKRISKHVLKAQEHQTDKVNVDTAVNTQSEPSTQIVAKTKKSKKKKIKDPTEAASYLSAWNHRDAGGGVWKFNKNNQSWLVRHMYEASKVPKATFEILMEYLAAGGEGMRSRILDDATRRALRYKEYEKTRTDNDKQEGESSEVISEQKGTDGVSPDEDETARWRALNDHDKRKEYKRARKILEVLKQQ